MTKEKEFLDSLVSLRASVELLPIIPSSFIYPKQTVLLGQDTIEEQTPRSQVMHLNCILSLTHMDQYYANSFFS